MKTTGMTMTAAAAVALMVLGMGCSSSKPMQAQVSESKDVSTGIDGTTDQSTPEVPEMDETEELPEFGATDSEDSSVEEVAADEATTAEEVAVEETVAVVEEAVDEAVVAEGQAEAAVTESTDVVVEEVSSTETEDDDVVVVADPAIPTPPVDPTPTVIDEGPREVDVDDTVAARPSRPGIVAGLNTGSGKGGSKPSTFGQTDGVTVKTPGVAQAPVRPGRETTETASAEAYAVPAATYMPMTIAEPTCEAQGKNPRNYTDGRRPVYLILQVFTEENFEGDSRYFFRDVKKPGDMIDGDIKSARVYKGPNYHREEGVHSGDSVRIYAKDQENLRLSEERVLELEPGDEFRTEEELKILNDHDGIGKIEFKHVDGFKCADRFNTNDRTFPSIPFLVELFDDEDQGGDDFVQLAGNVRNLGDLGFNDDASSVRIWKGPNWESSSKVELCQDENYKDCREPLSIPFLDWSENDSGREYMNLNFKNVLGNSGYDLDDLDDDVDSVKIQ